MPPKSLKSVTKMMGIGLQGSVLTIRYTTQTHDTDTMTVMILIINKHLHE